MRRYFGKVGFIVQEEVIKDGIKTGVWKNKVVEHGYYGDVIYFQARWQTSDQVNEDLAINDRISIIADTFVLSNLQCMKYAEYMGMMWKIISFDVQYPRVILTLGGKYNGEQA